jgi:excisionase family DNA binding protein
VKAARIQHLRLAEVAERFAHSKRWVQRLIKAGHLQAFRHGPNDVTVSLSSVEDYERRTLVS